MKTLSPYYLKRPKALSMLMKSYANRLMTNCFISLFLVMIIGFCSWGYDVNRMLNTVIFVNKMIPNK